MSWLWRTPAGLRKMSWQRGILVSLAAFIVTPVLGRILYGLNEWTRLELQAIELLATLMGVSCVLSWLGYALCLPVAMKMIRRDHGGAIPIIGFGAAVGAVLFAVCFWDLVDPFALKGLLIGTYSGGVCMALWWGILATTARIGRPQDPA